MSLDVLKQKINQLKRELAQLEGSKNPVPELINSTNLLRTNEILSKSNDKKTELLSAYESYFQELDTSFKKIKAGFSTLKIKSPRKKSSKRKLKRKTRKKKSVRKKSRKKSVKKRR